MKSILNYYTHFVKKLERGPLFLKFLLLILYSVNDGMKKWVGQWLKRAFEEWLQRRDRVTYDRYWAQRVAVKLAVQAAKRRVDRRWGQ